MITLHIKNDAGKYNILVINPTVCHYQYIWLLLTVEVLVTVVSVKAGFAHKWTQINGSVSFYYITKESLVHCQMNWRNELVYAVARKSN